MGPSEPSWPASRGLTGPSWTVTGMRLSASRQEQVADAVSRTAELLDREVPAGPLIGAATARTALAGAWQDVTEALAAGRLPPDGLPASVEVLRRIKDAEDGVRDDQVARRSSAGRVVRDALDALRGVRTVNELVQRAPEVAGQVGFDRVLLSRIDESTWIPERRYVARDERWADEIVQAGRQRPRTLDNSLLETQIVRRNRPLVVSDVNRPNLHRAMVEASRTRSYAAAPIVGRGSVIGFLHADC